jgi:hypothetical protein
MKIKLEMPSYNLYMTVESETDDLTIDEVLEMFKKLLLAAEYNRDIIDSIIVSSSDEA